MYQFQVPFPVDTVNAVEDEELEIRVPVARGPRRNRDRTNRFHKWDELEFCLSLR